MKGFIQQELDAIESFFYQAHKLPPEEILSRLASLATMLENRISSLFFQLEKDIETTLRIPREYLDQKVLNIDISDVSLDDLGKVLPLLTNQKRQISNLYYEKLFEAYQETKLNKEEKRLLKEAKERLKLFLKFQITIKEIVELYIEVKKIFASIKPPKSSEFQEISYLLFFEKIIDEKIQTTTEEVKKFTPILKQPDLLDNITYSKLMEYYKNELEQDFVRFQQLEIWGDATKNQVKIEHLVKIDRKARQLQRNNRGVIFILYSIKNNADKKLKTLLDETYSIEKMIDFFE